MILADLQRAEAVIATKTKLAGTRRELNVVEGLLTDNRSSRVRLLQEEHFLETELLRLEADLDDAIESHYRPALKPA